MTLIDNNLQIPLCILFKPPCSFTNLVLAKPKPCEKKKSEKIKNQKKSKRIEELAMGLS